MSWHRFSLLSAKDPHLLTLQAVFCASLAAFMHPQGYHTGPFHLILCPSVGPAGMEDIAYASVW